MCAPSQSRMPTSPRSLMIRFPLRASPWTIVERGGLVRSMVLEPPQAVRERGLGLQQLVDHLAHAHQHRPDRIAVRRADQLLGCLRRVDAVQARERSAELAHDGLAVALLRDEPQDSAGDRLAVESLTEEERTAEVLDVGADAADARGRDAGIGGQLAHRGFGADIGQLDLGGGHHGRDEPLDPARADGVEQQVAPASAGRALRDVLDRDLLAALIREPRGEPFRDAHVRGGHVSSLVQSA